MKQLDYFDEKERIEKLIQSRKEMVLATCNETRVTARTVYSISESLNIYFITSKAYLKYKQIEKNNHVALCFDNVQMEGIATCKGHPLDEENGSVMKLAKEHGGFMHFAKYKNSILIQVTITNVEMWENNGRLNLNVTKEESYWK